MNFKEWKEKFALKHVTEDMRERLKRLYIVTYEQEIEKLLLAEWKWFCAQVEQLEDSLEDGYNC